MGESPTAGPGRGAGMNPQMTPRQKALSRIMERVLFGNSIKTIAPDVGLASTTIYKMANGEGNMSTSTLRKLAHWLHDNGYEEEAAEVKGLIAGAFRRSECLHFGTEARRELAAELHKLGTPAHLASEIGIPRPEVDKAFASRRLEDPASVSAIREWLEAFHPKVAARMDWKMLGSGMSHGRVHHVAPKPPQPAARPAAPAPAPQPMPARRELIDSSLALLEGLVELGLDIPANSIGERISANVSEMLQAMPASEVRRTNAVHEWLATTSVRVVEGMEILLRRALADNKALDAENEALRGHNGKEQG